MCRQTGLDSKRNTEKTHFRLFPISPKIKEPLNLLSKIFVVFSKKIPNWAGGDLFTTVECYSSNRRLRLLRHAEPFPPARSPTYPPPDRSCPSTCPYILGDGPRCPWPFMAMLSTVLQSFMLRPGLSATPSIVDGVARHKDALDTVELRALLVVGS